MAVRDSIFGSRSEERGFRFIEHTWGEDYVVYPQIPLSALFTPDPKWRDTSNFFFKTSVDYVLCTNEGRPILAIDFDGLGRGFDRHGEYVQVEATQDRFRKRKFDSKLLFCRHNDFPYHIVSSDEFGHLADDIELTVVDGIIGSVLADKAFLERSPSFWQEHAEEIDSQPDCYRSEYIADLMTELELERRYDHSKILHKTGELKEQVKSITGTNYYGISYRPIQEPKRPSVGLSPDKNSRTAEDVLEGMKRVEVLGKVAVLLGTPVGEVSAKAEVRNVANPSLLVMEIAELMSWRKLLRLLQNQP